MGKSRSQSKTLSIKVPAAVSARIATVAKKRRVPVSVVVREALERIGDHEEASLGQLARDFCGRLSGGPSDLASNPRHLRGYGK